MSVGWREKNLCEQQFGGTKNGEKFLEQLERERARFPVLQNTAYLETAGTGLIPDYVYEG